MNGAAPKIEIFAPFGAAFEWMKTVLFRPFDFAKWLTIAFAAFLSGARSGGGFNPGQLARLGRGDFKYHASRTGDFPANWHMPEWGIALIVVLVVAGIALAVVFMWLSARGQFIYTDCIVRNRGAIVEPWKEYRREGNSFFFFMIAYVAIIVVITLILALAVIVPLGIFSHGKTGTGPEFGVALIVGLVVLGLIWFAAMIFFGLILQFVVPVMYRRRCLAREAFGDVLRLVVHNPAPFILYVLFSIVLALGVGVVAMLVACLTCCIGALPYISTCVLLPALVWLAAFKLLFLRQFGDAYDAWAGVAIPQLPIPPDVPPPSPAIT